MENLYAKTIVLADLDTNKTADLLAKYFIQSMAEMHADMWDNSMEESRCRPTPEMIKEMASDYAMDFLRDITHNVVEKIREMPLKAEYALKLTKLTFEE